MGAGHGAVQGFVVGAREVAVAVGSGGASSQSGCCCVGARWSGLCLARSA